MKLLIIEDNDRVRQLLENKLSREYVVETTSSGQAGLDLALNNEYELILLDLNLPDVSGHKICEELRQFRLETPIMVLSGENSPQTATEMLNLGADDYLTKPYYLEELKARIQALIRRNQPTKHNLVLTKYLKLDLAARRVFFNNRSLNLSKTEYLLLSYLIRHAGVPIDHFQLLDHIWSSDTEFDSNLVTVHIYNLRKKLSQISCQTVINYIHGRGYLVERV